MKENYVVEPLNELFNSSIIRYRRIKTGQEVAQIHQLRVNLKKINALYRLLGFVATKTFNAKSAFMPLAELFDILGMVRDLQIALEVVAHYDLKTKAYGANLKAYMDDRLINSQNQLLKWKNEHPGVGHFNQSLRSIAKTRVIVKSEYLEMSNQYISSLKGAIAGLVASRKKDKWHKIRIKIKRIRFVMDWALTLDKGFVCTDQYKRVRILGELLGDWHDRVIVTEVLILQIRDVNSNQQEAAARDFLGRLKNDQKALLAGARVYLRDLLSIQYFSHD